MWFFLFLGARLSPPPNPPKPNEKALKEKMDEKDLLSHPTNGKHKNSNCLTFFLAPLSKSFRIIPKASKSQPATRKRNKSDEEEQKTTNDCSQIYLVNISEISSNKYFLFSTLNINSNTNSNQHEQQAAATASSAAATPTLSSSSHHHAPSSCAIISHYHHQPSSSPISSHHHQASAAIISTCRSYVHVLPRWLMFSQEEVSSAKVM